MIRTALISTLAAAAILAGANVPQSRAGDNPAGTAEKNPEQLTTAARSQSPVSGEDRLDLRRYGKRFEKALRLIEKEAAKPDWGWSSE